MRSETSVEVLCLFTHSEVSSTKKVMFVLCLTVMNLNEKQVPVQNRNVVPYLRRKCGIN